MKNRTFTRIMLDIFVDNAMVKAIASIVNFCKEQQYYGSRELKFLKNMPINKSEQKQTINRYVFQSNKAIWH